jgi:hypothetical protein
MSAMSYRDQWNLLRGPARVRGRAELANARRKKKKGAAASSSEEDTEDEEDLDPIESRKRRRKRTARRTKFYKVPVFYSILIYVHDFLIKIKNSVVDLKLFIEAPDPTFQ